MRVAIPLFLVVLLAGCESSREQKLLECLQEARNYDIAALCRESFDDRVATAPRPMGEFEKADASYDEWKADLDALIAAKGEEE